MPVIATCGLGGGARHRKELSQKLAELPEALRERIVMMETSGSWCDRAGVFASIHASVEVSQSDFELLAQAIRLAGVEHCPMMENYRFLTTPTLRSVQVSFYGLDIGATAIDLVKQAISSSFFLPEYHNVASKTYRVCDGSPAPFAMIRPADRKNNDVLTVRQMAATIQQFMDVEAWVMLDSGPEMHFFEHHKH